MQVIEIAKQLSLIADCDTPKYKVCHVCIYIRMHTLNNYTIHDFNVYNKTIIYVYIYPPGCMGAAVKDEWHSERNSCVALCIATYIFLALIPYTDLHK